MERTEAIKILEYQKLWPMADNLLQAINVAIDSMNNIEKYKIVNQKKLDHQKLNEIVNLINIYFDCDCISKNRKAENIKGRFALGSYLRKELRYTLQYSGYLLNKKHETIMHYCKRHDFYMKNDSEYHESYLCFLKELKN